MIYWDDIHTVAVLQTVLQQGQVILASGDTVLGLWCNIDSQAYASLNKIKQRHDKPYLLVIQSVEKLPLFIDQEFDETLKNLVQTCWPGPVTLIFKARADLPDWMKSPNGTIAIRVPDHQGLLALLEHFDALFSTSANIHGQPIPESISAVDRTILEQVGAVCVEQGQLIYPQNPSTILDCSTGTIQIIRAGAFHGDMLRHVAWMKTIDSM